MVRNLGLKISTASGSEAAGVGLVFRAPRCIEAPKKAQHFQCTIIHTPLKNPKNLCFNILLGLM